ncbi:MAG TPA: hypothetical protein DD670_14635 [Planctomycetaceae bacterium]|nr:hypothetical protein [Planctomycetaceae bacterium]
MVWRSRLAAAFAWSSGAAAARVSWPRFEVAQSSASSYNPTVLTDEPFLLKMRIVTGWTTWPILRLG